MRGLRAALLGLCLAAPLAAQEATAPPEASPGVPVVTESIVSGLGQTRISITADFEGSEILVYGAVKRDGPPPEGKLDVIVTAEGPEEAITIRRKERVAGIWLNRTSVTLEGVPSYYAVVTTGPLARILSSEENFRHAITIDRLIHSNALQDQDFGLDQFLNGLIRVRSAEGRYRRLEGRISVSEETLFRADITLPANLTEGQYRIRIFLLRDGKVISDQRKTIFVRKEGLERFIYNLAMQKPLIYGLLSLALAVFAGWGASAAFRFVRN